MVTVLGIAKNVSCAICDRDAECFEADFGKLKGQFCRACFSRLVRSRSAKKENARREELAPASPNGQPTPPVK